MSHDDDLYKHYSPYPKHRPIEPGYQDPGQPLEQNHKKSTFEDQLRGRMDKEINQRQVQAAGYVLIEAMDLWTYLGRLPDSVQPHRDILLRPLAESLARLHGVLSEKDQYGLALAAADLLEKVQKTAQKSPKVKPQKSDKPLKKENK